MLPSLHRLSLATTGALPFLDPPLGPVLNATPSSPDYPAYQLASFCKPFGLQAAGTPLLAASMPRPEGRSPTH